MKSVILSLVVLTALFVIYKSVNVRNLSEDEHLDSEVNERSAGKSKNPIPNLEEGQRIKIHYTKRSTKDNGTSNCKFVVIKSVVKNERGEMVEVKYKRTGIPDRTSYANFLNRFEMCNKK